VLGFRELQKAKGRETGGGKRESGNGKREAGVFLSFLASLSGLRGEKKEKRLVTAKDQVK
jgi:hypothetical protein